MISRDGLLGCVIGLSLVFGLLSIVILLGYGLVKIPMVWFKQALNHNRLKHLQCKVAEYDEQLKEKAKKVQTLIEIINEVRVEEEINHYKEILKTDVVAFQEMIEQLEYFRLTFTASLSDRVGREFQGVLDYNKLVRLRNRFIYQTTDVVRLISFRREAIERAIFVQDVINSKSRGDRRVQSYYLKESCSWGDRDQQNLFFRSMTVLCKDYQDFVNLNTCRVLLASLWKADHNNHFSWLLCLAKFGHFVRRDGQHI